MWRGELVSPFLCGALNPVPYEVGGIGPHLHKYGQVHDLSNSHSLRVNKERRSIFLLMAKTYQVVYENMEKYEIWIFRPPHPSGGVNFGKKRRKIHILNVKFFVTMRKKIPSTFFIAFSERKI